MDNKEFLIRAYQRGSWEFITDSVEKIDDLGNFYSVQYHNSPKPYSFRKRYLEFYCYPEAINIVNSIVQISEKPDRSWEEARKFGPYLCLYSKGRCQVESLSDVKILPNIAGKSSVLQLKDYYQYITSLVEQTSPHLNFYYKKYLSVIREESVLNLYVERLQPKIYRSELPIFPFGVNSSQREAVIKSLENQVSLIQGPPGTGKTQTILNIIANLVCRGMNVAVVAGNNSATDNVYEKLCSLGFGFAVAKLGNNDLQDEFFKHVSELPDMSDWVVSDSEMLSVDQELARLHELLVKLLEAKNEAAQLNESVSRLKIEQKYFDRCFDVEPLNPAKWSFTNKWSTPNVLNFLAEIKHCSKKERLGWPTKLRWLYKYKIYRFADLAKLDESVTLGLISEFYHRKLKELEVEKESVVRLLEQSNFDELLGRYTTLSLVKFKCTVQRKFRGHSEVSWNARSYKSDFERFVDRFPILLSTTDSLVHNKKPSFLFDYVIVDESSQVDLVTSFLTMSCAKNIIAVGDLKQLAHIPNKVVARSKEEIRASFEFDSEYCYVSNSLLSSLSQVFQSKAPISLLVEHYRCHPRIIDFCNQKFYDGKLVIMTSSNDDPFTVFETPPGNHARKPPSRKGWLNVRELM